MKILNVDDSEYSRSSTGNDLSSLNIEIIQATDGKSGVDSYLTHQADIKLIIADYNMPKMNGLEMVEKIREISPETKIPIIMFSAEGAKAKKLEAKKLGVIAWVVKPCPPEKLLSLVKTALSRPT